METISSHHSHSALLSPHSPLDTMASSPSQPTFLKLEDLDNSPPLLTSSTYEDASLTSTAPQRVVVHSKPAKKRKSWGQELPEPKTTLPPRKRAKTDDEKEQRRIERIKRNRAAAHNSRERKRQETDHLAVALARANAELQAYRTHFGALPSSVVLPEVTLSTDGADTPAPSLSDAMSSRLSVDSGTTPPTPADSPLDQLIKEEPLDASFPLFPITEEEEPKSTLPLSLPLPQLDPTQHSAAMLCDLQCRSTCPQSTSSSSSNKSSTTSSSSNNLAILFLNLLTLNLTTTYRTLLLALWSTSPSRITRMMQASTPPSTSPSTTSSTTTPTPLAVVLSASTSALAQRNAATGRSFGGRQQHGARLVALLQRRVLREGGPRATSVEPGQSRHCTTTADSVALRERDGKSALEDRDRDGSSMV
ncbi:hypothetical protein BDY17DRAFT_289697, partial [Neohortaea acidophila]